MLAPDRRQRCGWTCAALVLVVLGAPGVGKTQPAQPLPAAAQAALEKGVAAAKAAQYPQAIAAFEDARKAAPGAPIVYLNLGLAESKIAGRELRAIAWLAAYLAAQPAAPNAAAVKTQIAALDGTNRANVVEFVKLVQSRAMQDPYDNSSKDVAILYARASAFGDARKAAELIPAGRSKDRALNAIAAEQAKALAAAASSQVVSGDMAGARDNLAAAQAMVDHIAEPLTRFDAELVVAEAQKRAGDLGGARKNLTGAGAIAASVAAADDRSNALTALGRARNAVGDPAGARESFAAAQAAALQSEGYERHSPLRALGLALAESGQIAAALRVADLQDSQWKTATLIDISGGQLRAGDVAGALATVNLIDGIWKVRALGPIAVAQWKAGDAAGARVTLRAAQKASDLKAEDDDTKPDLLIDLAEAERGMGDLAGAQRTLALARHAADRVPWNKAGGVAITEGYHRLNAQRAVARAVARVRVANDAAYEWLSMLDGTDAMGGVLSTAPFRDLDGHFKSMSTVTRLGLVNDMISTADLVITTSAEVNQKLKRQLPSRE